MGLQQILGGIGTYAGGMFDMPALGGAIGSGLGGFLDQSSSNDFNSAQAAASRSFQADQRATAYQTTVADMKAAGLNPMLAYSQGPTATPSSAQASYTQASDNTAFASQNAMSNEVSAYAAQNSSSAAMKSAVATVQKIEAEIPNINASKLNTEEQTKVLTQTAKLIAEQIGFTAGQTKLSAEQAKQAQATVALLGKQTTLAEFDIKAAKDMGNIGREMGQLKPIFDILSTFIRGSRR